MLMLNSKSASSCILLLHLLLSICYIELEAFLISSFPSDKFWESSSSTVTTMHQQSTSSALMVQPQRPNDATYWVTQQLLAGEYPIAKDSDRRLEDVTSTQKDLTKEKLRAYLDCGISYFLDLTQEGEKMKYKEILRQEALQEAIRTKGNSDEERRKAVIYKKFEIPDFGIPSKKRMEEILDEIDLAIAQNHKVYVHCRGGIGRTGTVVGCFLVRQGFKGDQALQEVNRLFQNSSRSAESYHSPETKEQMDFVRSWQE